MGADYNIFTPIMRGIFHKKIGLSSKLAPGAGLEPATSKLTASCSTIELPGTICLIIDSFIFWVNIENKTGRHICRPSGPLF